jgi:hypothetical protein
MKTVLRILGLTLALIAVFYTPASAFPVTCYYWCPEGRRTTSATYEECCGFGASGSFPCSDGSQGFPYGYEAWSGPQFC